ncbi:MAG TPA: hypothetical protein DEA46_05915 [Candidatus Moranbacteria bacterium]|nr:hypothetical protein [Candidatus Moranbacteria bacterium]
MDFCQKQRGGAMTKENIFEIYLKVLSLLAVIALLSSAYFILKNNNLGWQIFVLAGAITVVICELGQEYYGRFGYRPWENKPLITRRL